MRISLFGLVLLCALTASCILKQHAEHYASLSTLVIPPTTGSGGLKSVPGPNEIFRFRRISGIFFPFMFGTTDLYLEVSPQNLINDRTISVPSTGIGAYTCKEIHPGIFCAAAAGYVRVLKVSPEWVDVEVSLKAQNPGPRGEFEWSLARGIAFPRTEHEQ
jgi:hypothetical protein